MHSVASPNFLRFWSGQALAQFGMALGSVALPVISLPIPADQDAYGRR